MLRLGPNTRRTMELQFDEAMLLALADMCVSPDSDDRDLARHLIKTNVRAIDAAFDTLTSTVSSIRILNAFVNIYKQEQRLL
jgi:hypothetical protein